MMSTGVSAVVVTYCRPVELSRCLVKLSQQTVRLDEVRRVCEAAPSQIPVRYVVSPENSLPGARNLGVRHCTGEVVALIDDDAQLAEDYLEEVLRVFAERPEAVGVQGYIGSSSSYTVGLLHAIYALKGQMPTKQKLAEESIYIEQEILKETIGCQDQVLALLPRFGLDAGLVERAGQMQRGVC